VLASDVVSDHFNNLTRELIIILIEHKLFQNMLFMFVF